MNNKIRRYADAENDYPPVFPKYDVLWRAVVHDCSADLKSKLEELGYAFLAWTQDSDPRQSIAIQSVPSHMKGRLTYYNNGISKKHLEGLQCDYWYTNDVDEFLEIAKMLKEDGRFCVEL